MRPGHLPCNGAQFTSRLDQTANAYNTATLSSPNVPSQPYTLNGAGTEFSLFQVFATKAAMDLAYPFGTYTAHALNTVTSASNTDTISYTQDAYPSTQAVVSSATFTGLQGVNAAAPFTVNYNGFTPAAGTTPGQSFEFIDIFNSMGTDVFSQSFLPNTQMSVTIPAGTLMPGMGYTLSLDYSDRIEGSSTTGTFILLRLRYRSAVHDSRRTGSLNRPRSPGAPGRQRHVVRYQVIAAQQEARCSTWLTRRSRDLILRHGPRSAARSRGARDGPFSRLTEMDKEMCSSALKSCHVHGVGVDSQGGIYAGLTQDRSVDKFVRQG
jgi:hypothetical protein